MTRAAPAFKDFYFRKSRFHGMLYVSFDAPRPRDAASGVSSAEGERP